jgi:UDP:flavonoid glycosyltransferase YjiC (YdhE family)
LTSPVTARPRILFVAEAVTLAQVVRLVTLARALDPARFEIHFAAARFDELAFRGTDFVRHTIRSLAPEVVERLVASGKRLYDRGTLEDYLEDDRRVIGTVRPAMVVGDLRWSLAVAAPLARVPHAALINAYWSPHAERDGFPLPDHPIVSLLGEKTAAKYFPIAMPKVFGHFAAPLNALRRKHGLPEIGGLAEVLTCGDDTLFPDIPELVPTRPSAARHRYLGPVLWSPEVPVPPWWDRLDPARPTVYVTLGSSGRADRLPMVVDAIVARGLQAIVATAGRAALPSATPLPHVYTAPFVPGHLAARRAFAVISNGGSTTGYQALAEGRPVIGVASNLDQYLAMTAIERAGAGVLLRAGSLTQAGVEAALDRVRDGADLRVAAEELQRRFVAWDAAERFRAFVDERVEIRPAGPAPRP